MKKLNSLFLSYVLINICALLLASFSGHSQDVQGNRVITRQSFYLKDYWLTGVTRDTALLNDATKFPTSKAVYDFVVNRTLGGGGGGGSMVYPGAGIPLSTGSAWGTSITDNSANWNSAFGWGDHGAVGYALTSSLANYLLKSDTAAMLSNYLHSATAAITYAPIGTYVADSNFLRISASGIGVTQVKNKGIWLSNRNTFNTLQFSPALYFEGNGTLKTFQRMFTAAGQNILRFEGSPDSVNWYKTMDILASQAGQSAMLYLYGNSGGQSFLTLGNGQVLAQQTALSLSGAPGIIYNGANSVAHSGSTVIYNHVFSGITNPTNTSGTNVFMGLNQTINLLGTKTGSYEGVRINITETSIPSGQNYLFRAGKGGASFASVLDVTREGQLIVGSGSPDASLVADVKSITQAFAPPRMTATQASAITSPADGSMLYVSSTDATFTAVGFWGRENGVWIKL